MQDFLYFILVRCFFIIFIHGCICFLIVYSFFPLHLVKIIRQKKKLLCCPPKAKIGEIGWSAFFSFLFSKHYLLPFKSLKWVANSNLHLKVSLKWKKNKHLKCQRIASKCIFVVFENVKNLTVKKINMKFGKLGSAFFKNFFQNCQKSDWTGELGQHKNFFFCLIARQHAMKMVIFAYLHIKPLPYAWENMHKSQTKPQNRLKI